MSPLSNAKYSSLMVYKSDNDLLIFSGANIDPSTKEDLKIPEKRNCAETQAAIAAQQMNLNPSNLAIMFLYRKPEPTRIFTGEKLLPCLDCYKKYICRLIANKGFLVLMLDDFTDQEFLTTKIDNRKQVVELSRDQKRYSYRTFDSLEMTFLNIEQRLGSRVCSPIMKDF